MLLSSTLPCCPTRPCRQARRTCHVLPHSTARLVNDEAASTEPDRFESLGQGVTRRQLIGLLSSLAGLGVAPKLALAAEEPASPAAQAVESIRSDFVERQYYVTGNLSPELFAADCIFKDPTVEVTGVEPYVRALQILFDPTTSRADLISIGVASPNTVVLRWRLEGSLKVGGLKIKPYTGTTVYTVADNGKVVRHEETWDISTVDAFVSTFFPGFGAPPAPPVTPSSE